MARSIKTIQTIRHKNHRYFWPLSTVNLLLLLILAAAVTQVVVYALFMSQQTHFQVGTPWLFPFGITAGALAVLYAIVINVSILQQNIVPGNIIMLSIIILALFLTGFVETAIQLFGSDGVSENCRRYIINRPVNGPYVQTLAWLELDSICTGWYASFAFWIVGWLVALAFILLSFQVSASQVDTEDVFRTD